MYGTETDTLNRKNVRKWPALLVINEYNMEYSNTQTEHYQRRKHPEQVYIYETDKVAATDDNILHNTVNCCVENTYGVLISNCN